MNRLYVGNLPYTTTEQDLQAHFGQHGELKSVKIITDRDTGRSKGFGFVEFVHAGDAEAALSDNGQDFGGRALRVSEAQERERGGNGGGGGYNGGGGRERQNDRGDRGGDRGGRKRRRD